MAMLDERDYIQPPNSHFESDSLDYDVFRCGYCADNHSTNIYFDHLSNGNVCKSCIEQPDHQLNLGMNDLEYKKYVKKVLNQLPSNPL